MVKTVLPPQEAWVRFLVRELRSHMPHSQPPKTTTKKHQNEPKIPDEQGTFISSVSVQSLSCVRLFATPRTAARQASLSITNSQSSPKLMSIELVMPSSHLILCRPLLLLPSVFHSISVFSRESILQRPAFFTVQLYNHTCPLEKP